MSVSINNPLINTNNKTKYIIGGAFVLLFVVIGYFFLSKDKTVSPGGSAGPKSCTYGIDDKGNCIQPEKCGNNIKPPTNCPDGQSLICDPVSKKWRCKLSCESENNPFPYNFSYCQDENIKCSDGKYYCDKYCENGGILYSTSDGKCTCPKYFSGDKCECDASKCKDGTIDSNCDKCLTCCDKKSSVDGRCQYYGDNCENKCDKPNEVYYEDDKKCKCPLTSCFKLDNDGNCVALQTSQCCLHGLIEDGVCKCDPNSGWSGPNCDISICGDYGQWDKTQNKCICNKDANGNPLAEGDKCEYTREKLCSGNGIPQYDPMSRIASCKCDDGFSGDHCTCINTEKPNDLDIYRCKGTSFKCQETNNEDGTSSGKWTFSYKNCNDIYQEYGDLEGNEWKKECTQQIYPNNPYPNYNVICEPKSNPDDNGINIFPISQATCFGTPTDDQLKDCRAEGSKCYISWDDKNQNPNTPSAVFNSVCTCKNSDNGATYSCDNVTNLDKCGPPPSDKLCIGADGKPAPPVCTSCDNNYIYTCNTAVLPSSCIISDFRLNPNDVPNPNTNESKVWWNTASNDTVFPTINMDKCESVPFDSLYSPIFAPGYLSMESAAGFASKVGTENKKFYNWNDVDNILNYNVNADIVPQDGDITKGKINVNGYPFPEQAYKGLMFDNRYRALVGCAKIKNQYDPMNGDDNTRCGLGIDGKEAGSFKQYCADINGNIIPCSDTNSYYKTDKGYCDCNQYYSNVQKNDVKYKGKYCQYSDNETCSGLGIVDDNGKCKCLEGNKGPNCQYNDKATCNDRGESKDDGSCSCYQYTSLTDNTLKKYNGPNCQYSDDTTCKGQGIVDDNGICRWDSSKVFPRCSEFVNPNETNYDNLQCKTTVNTDLFTTNCIKKGLEDTSPQEYGCPINNKSTLWSPYTGYSCHTRDSDNHQCQNGGYPIRITSNGAIGSCQKNDESFLFNACRIDDISKVDSLKNIDFSGISNKTVTGIAAVACKRFEPPTILLSNSPNNSYFDYISSGTGDACWGNRSSKIDYVSETDWFNLPIGQGGIQQRL